MKAAMRPAWKTISCAGAPMRGLALGVLRTLASLVAAVLFALDLARIARQHTGLAHRRAQRLGGADHPARDAVPPGLGLRPHTPAPNPPHPIVIALCLPRVARF